MKSLTLPAVTGSLRAFTDFVREGAAASGIAADELGRLDLVLEEVLINVARYAYAPGKGEVEVRYIEGGGKLRVEVIDSGRVFNPLENDPPDLSRGLAERPIGGLGVFLVKNMVETIDYRQENGRNVLFFTFPPGPQ